MTPPTDERPPVVAVIGSRRVRIAPSESRLVAAALERRARRFAALADVLGDEHPRVNEVRRAADLADRCAGLWRCGGEWEPRGRERREVEAALGELATPARSLRDVRTAIAEVVAEARTPGSDPRLRRPRAVSESEAMSGVPEPVQR